jgi:hypothetical protein
MWLEMVWGSETKKMIFLVYTLSLTPPVVGWRLIVTLAQLGGPTSWFYSWKALKI